jgi:2-haloacid dehalogenase
MPIDRRSFLISTGLTISAGALAASATVAKASTLQRSRFKAIAFDGFPIFDPRPVGALAETLFPGSGAQLMDRWRTRQFEYQWLRALGGQYADFSVATAQSLKFAAKQLQLDLSADAANKLVSAFSTLPVWPDVPEGLEKLRGAGLRLAFLSNLTRAMMEDGLERAGLTARFDALISTDSIRTFKPDPRAYALGTKTLHLRREEILFVAFAGWDVAGAKWFGYPTFWLNRLDAPAEELEATPEGVGANLDSLVKFVGAAH